MSGTAHSTVYMPCSNRAFYYRARAAVMNGGVQLSCAICGGLEMIEIHHIDRDITNNSLNNLQPLCKNCHKQVHNGLFQIHSIE